MALLQTLVTAGQRHPVWGSGSIGKMLIEHVHGLGHDRGANAKCSFDQTHLSPDPWLQAPCPGLPFAQGAHHLEALDRGVGCRHRFETTHGLDQHLELAVVGLEHVVQVFHLPVFGFWGANDQFNPVGGANKLVERCPNARLVVLNRCGHWVQVEHREMFNRLCLDFLKNG